MHYDASAAVANKRTHRLQAAFAFSNELRTIGLSFPLYGSFPKWGDPNIEPQIL